MSPLTVTIRDTCTGPVLEVAGELDHHTAPRLRQAVEDLPLTPGQLLILDLARMDFCDSTGITVFVFARTQAMSARADIALVSVPANTARVLGVIGLDQIFAVHPDVASATASRNPSR